MHWSPLWPMPTGVSQSGSHEVLLLGHWPQTVGRWLACAMPLPTVWGQCPRSNTSWEPLWLTPVGIGHKGDQCIGGTLPSLNPHPCAPRGELDGLYPVDVSPKIGKLHRFQLSPFDRHTVHAQVVAVRSIGKEYPLAVRAELGVHRAKIFFQFPLGARCQVQNESAQFFDSRSARSHKGGVPPVGRDIGDYTVCDPRFVATQSWNPIRRDRKSTRLNSSHGYISYAVFCLKKKIRTNLHGIYQSKWGNLQAFSNTAGGYLFSVILRKFSGYNVRNIAASDGKRHSIFIRKEI